MGLRLAVFFMSRAMFTSFSTVAGLATGMSMRSSLMVVACASSASWSCSCTTMRLADCSVMIELTVQVMSIMMIVPLRMASSNTPYSRPTITAANDTAALAVVIPKISLRSSAE